MNEIIKGLSKNLLEENPEIEGIVTLTLLSLGIGLGEFEMPRKVIQNEE